MNRRKSHSRSANRSALVRAGSDFTRRKFLAGSALSALLPEARSAPGPHAAPPPGPEQGYSHRTQFDSQLLCRHPGTARPVLSNHGRQLGVTAEGHIITALAWNGDRHLLRIWREMEMIAEHSLAGDLSAPILIPGAGRRFKGFWRSTAHEPWGYLAVVSPDRVHWSFVKDNTTVVRCDDDLRLWIDAADAPERRFKATAIGRSFCGRVCVQWTSPDGMHWNDERDTLDYRRPFSARPDLGSTGRILLDSWSGPDDEDEIHGGYVIRDGDRWLLHYMKWTADGHIYCALASSRDGLNFARVAGGLPTLPLGAPGAWDGGRVALYSAPHRVGNVWRQYYTGCGWKHGLGGPNVRPSHFGLNAPNQMGLAEIRVGRRVHLQVERDAQSGTLTTIPLRLERPHRLALDVEGLTTAGGGIACAVLDPRSQRPFQGFGFDDCDRVTRGESGTSWRGRGLESLGSAEIRLRFRIRGHDVRLYGADLIPLYERR